MFSFLFVNPADEPVPHCSEQPETDCFVADGRLVAWTIPRNATVGDGDTAASFPLKAFYIISGALLPNYALAVSGSSM